MNVRRVTTLSLASNRIGTMCASGAWPIGSEIANRKHGKDNVVFLFVELEDELDSGELINRAEVNCGGGTEKIHGFDADGSPGTDVLEIKASCFLLKQNSHLVLGV